ncbi:MAG: ATP-binding protein [Planctomycetaceae bacterium]|nr:ATP-binding protein [Planctomycetaceae bacterium]
MGGFRIHTLLIVAVLLCGLAAIVPFAWSGAEVLSSFYQETTARELETNARLFSLALSSHSDGQAADVRGLAEAARLKSNTRYTVIRPDGTVVVDSNEDADRMENHRNRPEIQTAMSGGVGIGLRQSPTLGADWMYVAVPMDDGGVARAATSMEELDNRMRQWWKKALIGFFLSLAILAALATVVSRMLSRPIEIAADGAERYAKGELSYRLPVTGAAEMRRLATSMGEMAAQLDARFRLVNRQREEMRMVFENMSEGILAVDDAGQIMLMNSTAKTLLNVSRDVSGVGIEAATRTADLLDSIRETAETNESLEREIRLRDDDNNESLVQIHTVRISDGNEHIGVLIVLRDITRLRHLEIMRRDFVANVSHELRTPITTIQSCLETIQEDDADDTGNSREFVEMALRNTKRLGAIIDNLLFLAGMESGNGRESGTISVGPIRPALDEAIALCHENAVSQKTDVTLECDETLTARMNPQLVVHAVVNLIDNAIKYGPDGGTISVVALRKGDQVHITVADQGPGIARRYHSRIFERFYRVDGATRAKKGAGLGLAIVKHIALVHGGDTQIESEIGAGSRITLILPSE